MFDEVLQARTGLRLVAWRALISGGAGAVAGAVWGAVIGGVGGRVAMRVVFLTSDDRLRGLTSDDGFEIGRFSGETVALLTVTAVLGAIGGFLFGILRLGWAGPRWAVMSAAAVAIGTAAGGTIVHPTGIDFVFLEPLWLTVGLFVAIPAAWGAAVAATMETGWRFTADLPGRPQRWQRGLIGWAVVAGMTAWGVIELIDDIKQLR